MTSLIEQLNAVESFMPRTVTVDDDEEEIGTQYDITIQNDDVIKLLEQVDTLLDDNDVNMFSEKLLTPNAVYLLIERYLYEKEETNIYKIIKAIGPNKYQFSMSEIMLLIHEADNIKIVKYLSSLALGIQV
jgi:hypothetical protein